MPTTPSRISGPALLLLLVAPLALPTATLAQPKLEAPGELTPPPPSSYVQVEVTEYTSAPGAPAARNALAAPGARLDEEPATGARALRISVELALGTAGLFGGGLAGLEIGAAACDETASDTEWFPCLGAAVVGGGIGALTVTPLAIWLGGSALDGNGGLGWTFLGTSAGFLAWTGFVAAAQGEDVAWLGLLLPLAGGVLGFELSSDSSASAADAARERTHVSASLAPRPGGALVAVSGDF